MIDSNIDTSLENTWPYSGVKARSPVYYSTKMGKHADTTVRIEGKQRDTAP